MFIARGDIQPIPSVPIRSVLPDVSNEAWTRFVRVLSTQGLNEISPSNGLGCFEIRPKRLADLGLMTNIKTVRKNGRQVSEGTFVPPLTLQRFLDSPIAQYNVFVTSIERYDSALDRKEALPGGRSGALAILHRAGPNGLKSWARNKIESTRNLFEYAKDIF